MDGGEDELKELSGDSHLGELERDRAGMTHDAGADLDEACLQARQGRCRNLLGQVSTLQKHAEIGERPRIGSAHSAWQYRHGSNSSILLILWSAIRASTSISQACGSTPLSLAVSISV